MALGEDSRYHGLAFKTLGYPSPNWFSNSFPIIQFLCPGTSLVVQWLRICLPMQGTRVRSLVGELRSHMPWNSRATTTEPECSGAHVPQLERPCTLEPTHHNEREDCTPQQRACALQRKILHAATKTRHSQINKIFFKIFFKKTNS